MSENFAWKGERLERAAKLWSDGLSNRDMAVKLQTSTGSLKRVRQRHPNLFPPRKEVTGGKAQFLTFAGRRAGRASREKARDAHGVVAAPRVAVAPPPTNRLVAFADLRASACRFPFGDGPFLFCGQPVMTAPYCDSCRKVAYVRVLPPITA